MRLILLLSLILTGCAGVQLRPQSSRDAYRAEDGETKKPDCPNYMLWVIPFCQMRLYLPVLPKKS